MKVCLGVVTVQIRFESPVNFVSGFTFRSHMTRGVTLSCFSERKRSQAGYSGTPWSRCRLVGNQVFFTDGFDFNKRGGESFKALVTT